MNWTYTWIAQGNPVTTISPEPPTTAATSRCPRRASRSTSTAPARCGDVRDARSSPDSADPSAVAVGHEVQVDGLWGQISAIALLQGGGQHRARTSEVCGPRAGTLLAQATFTNETASGWQPVSFSQPVTILPNTTYVVGVLRPQRPLRRRRQLLLSGSAPTPGRRRRLPTARRCPRSPTTPAPTACSPTAARARSPTKHIRRRQLLGRPGVHAGPGARPGDQRHRRPPALTRSTVSWNGARYRRRRRPPTR